MAATVLEMPSDWTRKLVRKKNGEPYADERNVRIAFEEAPELKGILQYDEFRDRIELLRPLPGMPRDTLDATFGDDPVMPWCDEYVTELIIWLTSRGFTHLRKPTVQDTVIAQAKRHGYNPVREYLDDCLGAWDGKPRIDMWLADYLGARDNPEYLKAVGSKFLIGCAARIYQPGCQMDTILVLEGEQGKGKSTVVRILANEEWCADVSGDLGQKDAAIAIQNVWIGEMAELASLRRSEQESVKNFITRRIDHYRPPYARNAIDRPRHCAFIATTNEDEYLQDPTGARRYWPVECSRIDLDALRRDVRLLWGEAAQRLKDGAKWFLDESEARKAKAVQAARQRQTTLDTDVMEYAARRLKAGETRIEMRELLREQFDMSTREKPQIAGALAFQVSRCLVRIGWRRLKPTGRGHTRVQAYEYVGDEDSQAAQASQAKTGHSSKVNGSQGSQASQAFFEENESDVPF